MGLNESLRALGLEPRKGEIQILAQSLPYGHLNIEIFCNSKPREMLKTQKPKVKLYWQEHLKTHPRDFNGKLLSVKMIKKMHGNVHIFTRPCHFAEFKWSRQFCQGKILDIKSPEPLDLEYPLPLSVGPIVQTVPDRKHPNGCIVVSIRGNTAIENGQAGFIPSGYFSPIEDCKMKMAFPSQAALREMREEMSGIDSWSKAPKWSAIIQSTIGSCQPLITGIMEIPFTAKEVTAICNQNLEAELQKIFCVPADIESLKRFVAKNNLCSHDVGKITCLLEEILEGNKRY
ncbi:hypothetical protein M0Q50_00290 [bacterium]|jgi:hypothetical protein|nr:hypothetical protein [bacterium]